MVAVALQAVWQLEFLNKPHVVQRQEEKTAAAAAAYLRMLCESDVCLPNFSLRLLPIVPPSPAAFGLSDVEPVASPLAAFVSDGRRS